MTQAPGALSAKLEMAMNETRTLVLGAQIVLGFQFEAIFQTKFESLPSGVKWLNAVAIILVILALALLLAPVPYHRLVADGEDREDVHAYTTRMIILAPLPFALCISADVFIVHNGAAGIVAAAVLGLVALGLWYGIEAMNKRGQNYRMSSEGDSSKTDIHEKIKTILTEARIVLPGVQALLGIQFIAFLTDGFAKLPEFGKSVHFAALIALGLAVIMLMAPAAYHRIAAVGEDRPDVDSFAVRMVLGAMVPLAAALAMDLYLVLGTVAGWQGWEIVAAVVTFSALLLLWFGYPLYARRHRRA